MANSRVRSKMSRVLSFRKPGVVLGLVSLIALLAISVFAESWQDKDWTQWTSQDCYHILSVSPWAVEGAEVTDRYFTSPGREGRTTFSPNAVMVSSLVIRRGLVRQAQINQHYDKMKQQDKQQFDQMANTCLSLKLDDRIVVRASGPATISTVAPYLLVSGRKIPTMLDPQRNAVSPCPFDFVTTSKTNHDLVFPRVVDGEQVIQPGDKKVVIHAPWGNEFQFDPEKMIYKGKLDY
jgi:hypothetical protein